MASDVCRSSQTCRAACGTFLLKVGQQFDGAGQWLTKERPDRETKERSAARQRDRTHAAFQARSFEGAAEMRQGRLHGAWLRVAPRDKEATVATRKHAEDARSRPHARPPKRPARSQRKHPLAVHGSARGRRDSRRVTDGNSWNLIQTHASKRMDCTGHPSNESRDLNSPWAMS